MSLKVEKVIIIGSGPAGLTSAIYTARALLNPLMIEGEEAGGQLMLTTEVENYPGFEHGITGHELMATMRKQAARFGTRFISKNVSRVDFTSRPFSVWVGDQQFLTETVIISTGAKAKYLGLPSEKTYLNRGVSACATCDGAFYRGLDVAIVGGGDTAMEEALFLTRFAKKVYLIHRRDSFRASKIMSDRVLKSDKIETVLSTEVAEICGDGKSVTHLTLRDSLTGELSSLDVQGLFVAIGHEPNTRMFTQLDLHPSGYIRVSPGSTTTSIDGVFAAGDVQDSIYRQAITAAGSGCQAAIDVERWLEKNGL